MASIFDQLRNKLKELPQQFQAGGQLIQQGLSDRINQAQTQASRSPLFRLQAPELKLPSITADRLPIGINPSQVFTRQATDLVRDQSQKVGNYLDKTASQYKGFASNISDYFQDFKTRATTPYTPKDYERYPILKTFSDPQELAMSFGPGAIGSISKQFGTKLPSILKPLAQEAKNFSRFDEFVQAVRPQLTTKQMQVMEDTATGLKNIWDKFGDVPKMPVDIDRTKMSGVLLSKSQKELEWLAPKVAGKMEGFEKAPYTSTDVSKKIGKLDILWTPDRMLKRIGLEPEMNALRKSWDNYLVELPKEMARITAWSKRPGLTNGSEVSIFKYLDGQKVTLNPGEKEVALEIKSYLKTWADRLGLPEDRRVSNYITRLFDRELITKEFPDELVRMLQENVPSSTYDPFTTQRLGKLGYRENVWDALSAYVKRGVRKVNLDPALESISKASDSLEDTQYRYIKSYLDEVNMRPTQLDTDIDVSIKRMIGYKFGQRPVNVITQKIRQSIYRGALGLNPMSAIRNLTQGINSYSKLGERWTLTGYANFIKNELRRSDELERVGVLVDNFIEDRTISATRKFWENTDKVLFSFFNAAERINRGGAYFGQKAKSLAQGKTEQEAIQDALKLVRDTQFSYSRIDKPLIFSSDIAKTVFQFQTYNLKQLEFIKEMIQNKEFSALTRFGIANVVVYLTVGKALGFRPQDMIPFGSVLTGDTKLGQTPAVKFAGDVIGTAFNAPNEYGQQPSLEDRLTTFGKDLVPFIPGGVQAKRTLEGLQAYGQGASTTPSGRTRFEIEQTPSNLVKGAVFGQFSLPGASEYFANRGKSKAEIIYNKIQAASTPEEKSQVYRQMIKDKVITRDNQSEVNQYFQDQAMKITSRERQIRELGVKDGSRARAVVYELNKIKDPQKKSEAYRRYIKAKIITEDVAPQVAALMKGQR